ncbi:hypothetical protein L914_10878 [Phytophthora nicotianae]|uniref:Uncharacterized protein n=1 Tax=Phytophthora nicotianae TaxID=4792 RepID=W2N7U4_PHYNI|nr:hypothetical protein L914_10878 [Phytophthora nicotianae]
MPAFALAARKASITSHCSRGSCCTYRQVPGIRNGRKVRLAFASAAFPAPPI